MKSKPFSQDKKNLLLFTDIAGAWYTKKRVIIQHHFKTYAK